jgi:hypothetical protein
VINEGSASRLTYAALYLALWIGYTFYSAEPDSRSLPDGLVAAGLLATSIALGYVVGRWWTPLVVLAYLPILAIPSAYGDGQPNYSNGLVVALLVVPAAAVLVSVGVLTRKLTSG